VEKYRLAADLCVPLVVTPHGAAAFSFLATTDVRYTMRTETDPLATKMMPGPRGRIGTQSGDGRMILTPFALSRQVCARGNVCWLRSSMAQCS